MKITQILKQLDNGYYLNKTEIESGITKLKIYINQLEHRLKFINLKDK